MNDENTIVNERAAPGSGIKHDKHAPATEADIAAAEEKEAVAEAAAETPETIKEKQAEDCNNLPEAGEAAEPEAVPTMKNSKAEILAYCERQEISVDPDWNKTELLDGLAELFESENE